MRKPARFSRSNLDAASGHSGFLATISWLPQAVLNRADRQFLLLESNSRRPSLQFKKVGERNGREIWSVRVSLNYRALAAKREYGYLWFWIGDHGVYEVLIH